MDGRNFNVQESSLFLHFVFEIGFASPKFLWILELEFNYS